MSVTFIDTQLTLMIVPPGRAEARSSAPLKFVISVRPNPHGAALSKTAMLEARRQHLPTTGEKGPYGPR